MSLALSSLRSHFVKHLTSHNPATTFSSFRRRISRPPPPYFFFSSFPPPKKAQQPQQPPSRLNITAVSYSTHQLSNGTAVVDDSFTSPYLSVRICCPRRVSDVLSESLLCFGASSTTVDEQDLPETDGEIWISSTFDVNQDVKDCISRAADSIGLKGLPNYKVEMHDHTDWIKQTQESFHPVEIKEGLWIVPEWRNAPDLQAINIILNPGLAFGTGEHPTTKLCLLLLHRLIKGGEHFLDYGTGSGVLAIAALKFGAELSVGFDIEPQAITSAQYNAALNGIGPDELLLSLVPTKNGPHFESECQDSYDSKIIAEKDKYDVVIANILLYPLLDLADRIVSYGKPGATIGLSGIISEQVPTVTKHYSQFLEDINVTMMDDWACISGTKKTAPSTS
ncbi:ribosomal protein l11 methyltransferase [Phtheirospermum japonicum]|uniref:ETFB lysine methyltransferase n=1 Tax=Phtheirospermum japonicum TaxID=374723 RepID=A0A830B3U7_9LAMI|nr:ribosomal protein l11 methyltransferase [Phtheirospermum japonicum]